MSWTDRWGEYGGFTTLEWGDVEGLFATGPTPSYWVHIPEAEEGDW